MPGDPSPTFLALQTALAGRYALERELGRGGMGIVYLARDLSLDRPVAIKLLPPALAGVPSLRERFLREARTAARLSHPNIVPIHSVEEHGELVLFVMGYVEGETLGQLLARSGPLVPALAARVLQEVAWALAYAHRQGVVHRDVKPENILLERGSGRALVSDFGIAQSAEAGLVSGAGGIAGTVRFMSPEQLAGEPLDGRSDLYSLGVSAFLALAGRAPFETAPGEVRAALVLRGPAPPVASVRPDLPARLAAIVDRCLKRAPAERFPDGETLAEALGAARGRQVAVPLPVARFVDLYQTLGTEIASYAAILFVLAGETLVLWDWGSPLFPTILIYAFFLAVGLGGLRFIQLVRRARWLLDQGYSVGDVRAALERPGESAGERVPAMSGPDAGLFRRVLPWVLAVQGVLGAGIGIVAWKWWAGQSRGPIVDGLLYALFTLVPVVLLRNLFARMLRPGKKGWWLRLWWKVMEWKVFKIAGLGRARPAIAASEPTEVALGAGAQDLFDGLPPELRSRFAELPEVVGRLEGQACRLREAAGGNPNPRLASTLAAMEGLRLELLRLRAGTGTAGDLTGDLDAARGLADRMEALVAAHRELDEPTPVPGR
jgi:serine/threonine-protein kinase